MRVVLIEDHPFFRLGLRVLLTRMGGYEVVAEAGTAREAFPLIETFRPDLVLMDIVLPGMDGVVATREIIRRLPGVKVLIVSGQDGTHDVCDALAAGAIGYALKSETTEALLDALERVSRGESYVTPTLVERMAAASSDRDGAGAVLDVLSEREREVFRLAADCRLPQEIASELCLARKTVDTHLNRINRKLGLRNRADLVKLGVDLGLVHGLRMSRPMS